jgi:hypothetical protein
MATRGQRKKLPLSPMHVEIGARLTACRKRSGHTLESLGSSIEPPMRPQSVELAEKGLVNTPIHRLAELFRAAGAEFVIVAETTEEDAYVARVRRVLPYVLEDEEDRLLFESAIRRGERRLSASVDSSQRPRQP